jgi:hypothetical protein
MGGLVWLASYPKSGNTWTRHFLHSLIRGADKPHDINAMIGLTAGDSSANWYKALLDKPLKDCSEEDVAGVRMRANERIAAGADGLVFVKTHNALVSHHGAPMINGAVTAGAIYIVRNPLDVAISLSHFLSCSIDRAIAYMANEGTVVPNSEKTAYSYYGSWSENVLSWTHRPMQHLHVMRYEDMVERPLDAFGRLADWLLLRPTPRALEAAIEASSFDRLKQQEEEAGFIEKPKSAEKFFREGRAGQWEEILTGLQIAAIVDAHRDQMARFGYLPD